VLASPQTDQELAGRLGRTKNAVEARRIQLQIPKFNPKLNLWTPEEDALVGAMTDGEVASRLRLTISAVAHRRRRLGRAVCFAHRRPWTPQEDALLGSRIGKVGKAQQFWYRQQRECVSDCHRKRLPLRRMAFNMVVLPKPGPPVMMTAC
jgi:hypothetical protein